MKRLLEDELITSLLPYFEPSRIEDAKLRIAMVLNDYEVRKEETQLIVYEGDLNDQILKRFLMAKIARGLSARTVQFYKNSISFSLERINKPYNEITADDIRAYLAVRVHRDGVSKTTANNERRNLSSFYCWLQKEAILLQNPMNRVELIKETKKKKNAFSQMEIEKIRNSCKTTMETALVEILISTWARVSEIAAIRLSEISGNHIIVHGKGDKDRDVYLNAKAQLAIEKYIGDRHDENPYLFPKARYAGDVRNLGRGKKGFSMYEWYKVPDLVGDGHRDKSSIEHTIRKIGRIAKVENTHPHRFRRTGATFALRNGMPLMQVSKILGHESIGTTQIYLDISDKELEQAHEKWVI